MLSETSSPSIDQALNNQESAARLAVRNAVEEAEKNFREKFPKPVGTKDLPHIKPVNEERLPDVDTSGMRSPYLSRTLARKLSEEIQEMVTRPPKMPESSTQEPPKEDIITGSTGDVAILESGGLSMRRRRNRKKPLQKPPETIVADSHGPVSEGDPASIAEVRVEVPPETIEEYQDAVYSGWGRPQKEVSPENEVSKAEHQETTREIENTDVERLQKEVEELRMAYVKEDYETTSAWSKLRTIFGRHLSEDEKKREYQELYENALLRLQEARLASVRQSGVSGQELKDRFVELLRFTKLDEAIELASARTEYRAEQRAFPEKVVDAFGTLGRWYNRIPRGKKLVALGLLTGSSIALAASGGTAGAAMVGLVVLARKGVASAGLSIAFEQMLDISEKRHRTTAAEKEITDQVENQQEITFDKMQELIQSDILSLDKKLQSAKFTKARHKAEAIGLGTALGFGAGYLLQHYVSDPLLSAKEAHLDTTSIPKPEGEIQNLLNGSVDVQKGDSVWKILSTHTKGLEGAQKTHFVDALKDKVGDVQLTAGEKFDFSKYINSEDIQKAYMDAKGLSADKIASIAGNDLKVSEYVNMHPGTHLTHEAVDTILQEKANAAVQHTVDQTVLQAAVSDVALPAVETGVTSTDGFTPETIVQYRGRVDGWFGQIFQLEDVRAGQTLMLDNDKIGSIRLMDAVKDADLYRRGELSGYRTGLSADQLKNFAEFSNTTSKTIGKERIFEMLRAKPNMTVTEYLQRVAPLVRHGQHIGPYITV